MKTLLMVDDDLYSDHHREVIALRPAFRMLEATDLFDAVALIDQHAKEIDIALIDLRFLGAVPPQLEELMRRDAEMDRFKGFALGGYLHSKAPQHPPIVFWTSYVSPKMPESLNATVMSKSDPQGFGEAIVERLQQCLRAS